MGIHRNRWVDFTEICTNEKTMSQIGRDGFIPPLTIQCLECDFLDDVKRYPGLSMRRTASWDDGEEKYIEM